MLLSLTLCNFMLKDFILGNVQNGKCFHVIVGCNLFVLRFVSEQ